MVIWGPTRVIQGASDPLWIERDLYRGMPRSIAEQMLLELIEAVAGVCWIWQVHPAVLPEVTIFKE